MQMKRIKALGSDGFPAELYQTFWEKRRFDALVSFELWDYFPSS
jgi:hypothetical protein